MQPESTLQEANSAEFIVATSESIPEMTETPSGNSQNPTPHSDSNSLPGDDLSKPAQLEPNRETFWRATIQQQLQSGLSILEFCRQRKLSSSGFHRWKTKITNQNGKTSQTKKKTAAKQKNSAPTFIPVSLDPVRTPQPQLEQPQVEILYASGTTVRIASGCDAKTVSIILKAMGNGTC